MNNINHQVQHEVITISCWDCAIKHRIHEPYDRTYTARNGTCQICNEQTQVTSAQKLFGYHKIIG